MTSFLGAAELAAMREVETLAMPGTAYIVRYVLVPDGMGGNTQTWTTVGTCICDVWMMNLRDREAARGGQVTSLTGWFITVPFGTDITAKDWVTINARTFQITAVPNGETWQTALRCEAIALNEETRLTG